MVDQVPFIVSVKSENKYKYQTFFNVVNNVVSQLFITLWSFDNVMKDDRNSFLAYPFGNF